MSVVARNQKLMAPLLLLNVYSRSSNADKLIRSPFKGRTREAEERENRAWAHNELKVTQVTGRGRRNAPAKLESELGQATYNCGCGFIFEAAVLTSVDCPHCGDSQAW
jgi:hypothetical protein